MPQYEGLSINQHQKIAAELLAMQEKTRQIFLQILEAYGVSKKVTKCAQKLMNEVGTFKSEMDKAYFNNIGPEAPHTPYYPVNK